MSSHSELPVEHESLGVIQQDDDESARLLPLAQPEVSKNKTGPGAFLATNYASTSNRGGNSTQRTPLPWRQLMLVFALRTIKPLMFELIFPFVNQMILEIGVVKDPEQVGFYSGFLESIFSCMSLVFIVPSSSLSDRYGRKPVVLIAMSGLIVSVALFGMSRSFWFMVLTRCIGGGGGAAVAALRVMVAELTDRSNQATALTGYAIAYRLGQSIGQPMGGLLAHPERQSAFFDRPFWRKHPFTLPGFVAAGMATALILLAYLFLDETLLSKQRTVKVERIYGRLSVQPTAPEVSSHGTLRTVDIKRTTNMTWTSVLKTTPGIIPQLLSRTLLFTAVESMFALYPLFAFTPIASGGLGLSEAAIGLNIASRAVFMLGVMFLTTSFLHRFGALNVYRASMALWPPTFALLPVLNVLARKGGGVGEGGWLFRVLHSLLIVMWATSGLAFPAGMVMINDLAPSAQSISTVISMSEVTNAFAEAVSPAFVNSIFAFTVKNHIFGGGLTYLVMIGLTTFSFCHSLFLTESMHDWRTGSGTRRIDDDDESQ